MAEVVKGNLVAKPDEKGFSWPSTRYGPDGQSGVFNSADEVPKGWEDHPAKVKPAKTEKTKGEPKALDL